MGACMFFFDPPYEENSDNVGYAKGSDAFDFERFARVVQAIKGKWIITINDSKNIRKLFARSKIHGVVIIGSHANILNNGVVKPTIGSKDRKELLISNYDFPSDWKKHLPARMKMSRGGIKALTMSEKFKQFKAAKAKGVTLEEMLEEKDLKPVPIVEIVKPEKVKKSVSFTPDLDAPDIFEYDWPPPYKEEETLYQLKKDWEARRKAASKEDKYYYDQIVHSFRKDNKRYKVQWSTNLLLNASNNIVGQVHDYNKEQFFFWGRKDKELERRASSVTPFNIPTGIKWSIAAYDEDAETKIGNISIWTPAQERVQPAYVINGRLFPTEAVYVGKLDYDQMATNRRVGRKSEDWFTPLVLSEEGIKVAKILEAESVASAERFRKAQEETQKIIWANEEEERLLKYREHYIEAGEWDAIVKDFEKEAGRKIKIPKEEEEYKYLPKPKKRSYKDFKKEVDAKESEAVDWMFQGIKYSKHPETGMVWTKPKDGKTIFLGVFDKSIGRIRNDEDFDSDDEDTGGRVSPRVFRLIARLQDPNVTPRDLLIVLDHLRNYARVLNIDPDDIRIWDLVIDNLELHGD